LVLLRNIKEVCVMEKSDPGNAAGKADEKFSQGF
jgi:hypothetical protein